MLKYSLSGHVARCDDDRWSKGLTGWWPRDGGRYVGRPPVRWVDVEVKTASRTACVRVANEEIGLYSVVPATHRRPSATCRTLSS